MNSCSSYYVYVLCNPLKAKDYKIPGSEVILPFEPFYIGKGKCKRKDKHLWEVRRNIDNDKFFVKNNKHKKNTIRIILKAGLELKPIVIKNNLSNLEACALEISLIKLIGREDLGEGCLTNLTNGGEGSEGYVQSPEICKAISERVKANPISFWLGKKMPQYAIDSMRATKLEQYKLGLVKPRAKTNTKALNALPIVVYNPFTETYSEYDSTRSYLGIGWSKKDAWKFGKINACCRNEMVQWHRLIFMYKKDFNQEYLKQRLEKFKSLPKGKNKPYRIKDDSKAAA